MLGPFDPTSRPTLEVLVERTAELSRVRHEGIADVAVHEESVAARFFGGQSRRRINQGGYAISVPTGAFYRITVRVLGPRNTVSFVQATVY